MCVSVTSSGGCFGPSSARAISPRAYDARLNDTTFVSGGLSSNEPLLIAKLSDDSGINMAGVGVGHEMLLVINGNEAEAIDVGHFYQSDLDTFRSGSLRYRLPPLEAGPNTISLTAWDVVNNKPHTQAYRAPGSTQAAFATEQVIDELADKLKIDPIEFRLKNAAKEGTRRVDGPVYPRVGLIEPLEAARQSDHWKSKLDGKWRGRGIASGFWFNIGGVSSCSANVNDDGTVTLLDANGIGLGGNPDPCPPAGVHCVVTPTVNTATGKNIVSVTPFGSNAYRVLYEITVSNTGGSDALYTLFDELNYPLSGVTLLDPALVETDDG